MEHAPKKDQGTTERVEILKAESAHLLKSVKSKNSPEHAMVRVLEQKIEYLSGHLKTLKIEPRK